VAEDDNTHWYYPLNDALTSTTVVVDFSGVIAAQLFGPYGQARWAGGSMPTTFAFTGQRADATTGLDYYGARYYDPAAGTFISADSVLGKGAGLNRYAYVAGNPETLTDPTGHRRACSGCGSGGSGGSPPSNSPCRFSREDCEVSEQATIGCDNECQQIYTTFHDKRTVAALEYLLLSPFGMKVVEFLFKFAAYLLRVFRGSFKADDLFTYDSSGGVGKGGGQNDGLFTTLNPDTDPVSQAGIIAHEAMEVYFVQADGVNGNSYAMDYIADYQRGQVEADIAQVIGDGRTDSKPAFGDNYAQWRVDTSSGAGPSYASVGDVEDTGIGIGPWGMFGEKTDNNFLGNPMGLSLNMLKWESYNSTGCGLNGDC
jgi:RHS repeat-associated protein